MENEIEATIDMDKKVRLIGLIIIYMAVVYVFFALHGFEYSFSFDPEFSPFSDFVRDYYWELYHYGIDADKLSVFISYIMLILPWIFRKQIGHLIQRIINKV